MNQKTLIAIIILAGIGSIGSVLAYSGTISAGQGNFNNVLVTGTCTGCGGGEGSFTNYNTVVLNGTTPGSDTFGFCASLTGNDGATLIGGSIKTQLTYLNGTTVYNAATMGCNEYPSIAQSSTGEYKVVQDGSTFITSVYKNGNKLQDLGVDLTQFHTANGVITSISPDGHYISVIARDSGAASDRILVFRGS